MSELAPKEPIEAPKIAYTTVSREGEPRTMTSRAEQQAWTEPLDPIRAGHERMTQLIQQLTANKPAPEVTSQELIRKAARARFRAASTVIQVSADSVRRVQIQDHPSSVSYISGPSSIRR